MNRRSFFWNLFGAALAPAAVKPLAKLATPHPAAAMELGDLNRSRRSHRYYFIPVEGHRSVWIESVEFVDDTNRQRLRRQRRDAVNEQEFFWRMEELTLDDLRERYPDHELRITEQRLIARIDRELLKGDRGLFNPKFALRFDPARLPA